MLNVFKIQTANFEIIHQAKNTFSNKLNKLSIYTSCVPL